MHFGLDIAALLAIIATVFVLKPSPLWAALALPQGACRGTARPEMNRHNFLQVTREKGQIVGGTLLCFPRFPAQLTPTASIGIDNPD